MKYIKCLASLLCLVCFTHSSAIADDALDRKRAAEDLMQAMQTDTMLDQIFPTMVQQVTQAIFQGGEEQTELVRQIVAEEFSASLPKFKPDFIDLISSVYQQNFSAQEMNEIAAFMRSPVGQKFLSRQAELTQQAVSGGQLIGQKMAQDAVPRVLKRMQDAGLNIPG